MKDVVNLLREEEDSPEYIHRQMPLRYPELIEKRNNLLKRYQGIDGHTILTSERHACADCLSIINICRKNGENRIDVAYREGKGLAREDKTKHIQTERTIQEIEEVDKIINAIGNTFPEYKQGEEFFG